MGLLKRTLNVRKLLDIVLVVLIGWLSWSTVASLAYVNRTNQEVTRTFAVLQEESARTLAMQKELQEHRSPAYIEKVGREDLLLSRKGDTVILFPREPAGLSTDTFTDTQSGTSDLQVLVTRLIAWVKGWF
jgi:cell division protein FtsB